MTSNLQQKRTEAKLAKAERMKGYDNNLPGPGMYEVHNQSQVQKAKGTNIKFGTSARKTFGMEAAEKGNQSSGVGPGGYNVEHKTKGGFSFGMPAKQKQS